MEAINHLLQDWTGLPLMLEHVFLLLLAPLFFICVALEYGLLRRRGQAQIYSLRDTINNAVLALSHQLVDALAWSVLIGVYVWVHQYRLFEIQFGWASAVLLWLGQDFLYYWFHRCSHRARWLWASHVVHHSSERMNLTTAFRQSLTYPLSGMWVFWLPLAWLGFAPQYVILTVAVSLAYQFFIHTQTVGKLHPWLELVLNTPSHHRVHHARNAEYIDRNYAGTLIIWDRLFGTFVEERDDEPCEFGITRQIHTENPLVMMFHEWRDMFADVARPGPMWLRLKHLWAPPEFERARAPAKESLHAAPTEA